MHIEMMPDANAVASRGAALVGQHAREAISQRGRFVLAVSGGTTPWLMLRMLGSEALPWDKVHIVQVDERIAPAGHSDRNLTQLIEALQDQTQLPASNVHAMPVNAADIEAASLNYARTLESVAESPATIDLVHLGLGSDGHTASLVPHDPVLQLTNTDVGITKPYQGRQRMTLTYPIINRARHILWLVTGGGKAASVAQLVAGDVAIPAGRVRQSAATLVVDAAAGSGLEGTRYQRENGED